MTKKKKRVIRSEEYNSKNKSLQNGTEWDFFYYLNLLLFALIFIFPLVFFKLMAFPSDGPRWLLLSLCSIFFPMVSFIYYYFKKKEVFFTLSLFRANLLLFLIWLSLSVLWVNDKLAFVQEFINHFAFILLLLFFLEFGKKMNRERAIFFLTLAVSFVSGIGILQYYEADGGMFAQLAKPASTFVNKNLATPMLAMLFPITLERLLFSVNYFSLYYYSLSFILTLTYLVVAATRSAWVGAAASLFFLMLLIAIFRKIRVKFFENFKLSRIAVLFVCITISVLLIKGRGWMDNKWEGRDIGDQFNFLVKDASKDQSRNERLNKWENGLAIIKDNPVLGIGLSGFDAIYPKYHNANVDDIGYSYRLFIGGMHNETLQYLVELGVPGVFLFLSIFILLFYFGIFSALKEESSPRMRMTLFLLGSLLAVLGDSCFNYPFHSPTHLFNIALVIAIIYSNSAEKINDLKLFTLSIKKPSIKMAFFTCFSILFLISIYTAVLRYNSDVNYKAALRAEGQGSLYEAWHFAKASVDYWPYRSRTKFDAARIGKKLYSKEQDEKNFRNAWDYNEIALQAFPNHYMLMVNKITLAMFSKDKSRLEQVEKYIPLLLKVAPTADLDSAEEMAAQIFLYNGKHREAYELFKKLSLKNPDRADYRGILQKLGN